MMSSAEQLDEAVLLSVLSDVRHGDFSARMPLEWTGVAGKIADSLNDEGAGAKAAAGRAGGCRRWGPGPAMATVQRPRCRRSWDRCRRHPPA